jgi:CRP-like cAMP-binding protein
MRVAEKFIQELQVGEVIFEEGSHGNEMFIVLSGEVEIVKNSTDGEKVVAVLIAGEMFGEMALLDTGTRFATARSGSARARVVRIDQARFVYLVSQQPAFALSVMRVMARRLASTPPATQQAALVTE